MTEPVTFLGVGLGAIGTGALTWLWRFYIHRDARRERDETKAIEVEKHRDDLTLQLLRAAKDEVAEARQEAKVAREENNALRAIEEHFYHFDQALNHLEAVLTATDADTRAVAEKNAKAFLARMRRLQRAKGNIQQEVQIIESANRLEGKE
ncbi:hypothetical protein [Sphingopyxis macrogoltabida]|uniref:Uncharacterized protein n=1 Tax=Sphingopyxis macrogoltabida TaxID=33050 RepID=A0A0N7GT96_SPHMC|nr:hypothetical protein [Sphingopyxis macrogoltabida]ALH82899.1 hypothetical protein AN936_21835 [Sphingopyxis macrogoltabida]